MDDLGEFTQLNPELRLYRKGVLAIRPMHRGRYVSGDWHVKHISEWARLWTLPLETAIARLRDPKGAWPFWALRLDELAARWYLARRDGVSVDGKVLTVKELAERCKLTPSGLRNRFFDPRNPTMDEVLRLNTRVPRPSSWLRTDEFDRYRKTATPFTYDGFYCTLREHCERMELPFNVVRARMYDRTVRGKLYPGLTAEQSLAAGARKERTDKGGRHAKRRASSAAVAV
jgi:hypothetical protein